MDRPVARAEKALIYKTKSFRGDTAPKGSGKRAAAKARRRVGKAIVRVAKETR